MTTKQSTLGKYATHREAQLLVRSKLERRGYLVTERPRNAALVDLFAVSPSRKAFLVEVRGQMRPNFWLIQRREPSSDVFFVLVYMPKSGGSPHYFVFDCAELMRLREEYKVHIEAAGGKYRDNLGGVNWRTVFEYEDEWESLPS